MQVTLITDRDAQPCPAEALPTLLESKQGLVWVDIPVPDESEVRVLSEVFGFHPRAIRDCTERNHVPRVHVYPDHLFVVLHAPEEGVGGHVHYVELDQFIGRGYLVTLHGPLAPSVPVETAMRETRAVLQRIQAGRLRPESAFRLSHAIVSTLVRHEEDFVARRARTVGVLERHVRRVADSQREFLQGVIDFYRAQTDTKMLTAAERLAVIAAVTLPVTAISSVLGMNVIVNSGTDFVLTPVLLAVMAAVSAVLLRWTKRKGWW